MVGLLGHRVGVPATEWGEDSSDLYWGTIVQIGVDTNGNDCVGIQLDGGSLFHWPTSMALDWLDQCLGASNPNPKRQRLASCPPGVVPQIDAAAPEVPRAVGLAADLQAAAVNADLGSGLTSGTSEAYHQSVEQSGNAVLASLVAAVSWKGEDLAFAASERRWLKPHHPAFGVAADRPDGLAALLPVESAAQIRATAPADGCDHGASETLPAVAHHVANGAPACERPLSSRGSSGLRNPVDKETDGCEASGAEAPAPADPWVVSESDSRAAAADGAAHLNCLQTCQSRACHQQSSSSVSNADGVERHDVDSGASAAQPPQPASQQQQEEGAHTGRRRLRQGHAGAGTGPGTRSADLPLETPPAACGKSIKADSGAGPRCGSGAEDVDEAPRSRALPPLVDGAMAVADAPKETADTMAGVQRPPGTAGSDRAETLPVRSDAAVLPDTHVSKDAWGKGPEVVAGLDRSRSGGLLATQVRAKAAAGTTLAAPMIAVPQQAVRQRKPSARLAEALPGLVVARPTSAPGPKTAGQSPQEGFPRTGAEALAAGIPLGRYI